MNESAAAQKSALSFDIQRQIRKTATGKIKTGAVSKSGFAIKATMLVLLGLSVLAFFTFDYKDIDFAGAVQGTLRNAATLFAAPKLKYASPGAVLNQLFVTFCLGILSTILGAAIAFFGALLCAGNISNPRVSAVIKGIVAFVRAVPTVLWVLIFAVTAGLGSVAAVSGLTFHSAGYLIKAYAESIEEMDYGTIEALKASGAGFWQIVFQAILPSSISYMLAWTFLRFEINFTNAIAMGAAAGAGGIGYNLFMAGYFYFDLREMGYLTYAIVLAVVLLEIAATKIKAKVK